MYAATVPPTNDTVTFSYITIKVKIRQSKVVSRACCSATHTMPPKVHFWYCAGAMTAKLGLLFSGTTEGKQQAMFHLK